jgi:hypothetical protein
LVSISVLFASRDHGLEADLHDELPRSIPPG